jgi:hypothetical protein
VPSKRKVLEVANKASEDRKEAEKDVAKRKAKISSVQFVMQIASQISKCFCGALLRKTEADKNPDGIQESTGHDSLNTEPVKLR